MIPADSLPNENERLAELMNTALEVKSRWQQGCVFFFTLPIGKAF
ncbi:MAG: hypothetical protein ACOC0N_06720 [Chroococcales cyanobacterium]